MVSFIGIQPAHWCGWDFGSHDDAHGICGGGWCIGVMAHGTYEERVFLFPHPSCVWSLRIFYVDGPHGDVLLP